MRQTTAIYIRALTVLVLAIAGLILLSTTRADAKAVRIEKADRNVSSVWVAYTEPRRHGSLYVEFNNGATYRFTRCHDEGTHNCYWNARVRGNGAGDSFLDLRGRVFYLHDNAGKF